MTSIKLKNIFLKHVTAKAIYAEILDVLKTCGVDVENVIGMELIILQEIYIIKK